MEKWQVALDRWLTTPPEDCYESSSFCCDDCGKVIEVDETYYEINGNCLCEKCTNEWVEAQAKIATEDDCYGEG